MGYIWEVPSSIVEKFDRIRTGRDYINIRILIYSHWTRRDDTYLKPFALIRHKGPTISRRHIFEIVTMIGNQ